MGGAAAGLCPSSFVGVGFGRGRAAALQLSFRIFGWVKGRRRESGRVACAGLVGMYDLDDSLWCLSFFFFGVSQARIRGEGKGRKVVNKKSRVKDCFLVRVAKLLWWSLNGRRGRRSDC